MRASSISQKRDTGIPPYTAGVGMILRPSRLIAVPSTGSGVSGASTAHQSRWPPWYSSARSSRPGRLEADTSKAYSSRWAFQALGGTDASACSTTGTRACHQDSQAVAAPARASRAASVAAASNSLAAVSSRSARRTSQGTRATGSGSRSRTAADRPVGASGPSASKGHTRAKAGSSARSPAAASARRQRSAPAVTSRASGPSTGSRSTSASSTIVAGSYGCHSASASRPLRHRSSRWVSWAIETDTGEAASSPRNSPNPYWRAMNHAASAVRAASASSIPVSRGTGSYLNMVVIAATLHAPASSTARATARAERRGR
ncbi:UNVERIFIED_CONTAM: hypothetical protein RKD43_007184 [Streptomyces graminofaciens]